MPSGPRLDAPGALDHIIARRIERGPICRDERDQRGFVARPPSALKKLSHSGAEVARPAGVSTPGISEALSGAPACVH